MSLEQAVAAPFASRQLADLGARVIKVERPGVGDFARKYDDAVLGESSYFVWLNRGKESIELDIKDPGDRALLDTMIDSADVVIQNLLPGSVERLRLDAATLRLRRPELIYCSISGYGPGGPFGDRKAYDLLIQCETGMVAATGTAQDYAKTGVSIADIATGTYAYTGILTALYERQRTGAGASLEVAMLDALGEWMIQPAYYSVYGQRPTRRTGARHASIAPYGPYRCGDGADVFLAVQSDREWAVLCATVLDQPWLAEDPRFTSNVARVENDAHITPLVEQAFARLSADEAAARLEAAGIAAARIRTPAEFFEHPQLQERGRWRDVRTPGGTIRGLLPPVTVQGREAQMGEVPSLGQHSHALRREFAPTTVTNPGANRNTPSRSVHPSTNSETTT